MNDRQLNLLKIIIEAYVSSAEPIGSGFLVSNYNLGVSAATVRNDMVLLEKNGYLRQPHTSAGRIPTEKGYQFYLETFVQSTSACHHEKMRKAVSGNDGRVMQKLAKVLVELSGETALVGYGDNQSYCTGISNLFAKPDFQTLSAMQSISHMVDRFEEVVDELQDMIGDEPAVYIGQENPFGEQVSAVVIRIKYNDHSQLLGLVGPMRMDYRRNLELLRTAKELTKEIYG